MALGALLRSGARGSQTTPQEVLGTLRKEAQNKAVMQLQLAQMQAAAAQKQKLDAAWENHIATLSPDRQRALAGIVEPAERQKILAAAGAPPKPFQLTKVNDVQYMVFTNPDGTTTEKKLDLPEDVNGEWKDYDYNGDGLTESVFVNKRTGLPILNANQEALVVQLGQTAAQKDASARGWANVGISRERLTNDKTGTGPVGSTPVQITDDAGKPRIVQWSKRDQAYYEVGTGKKVKRGPSQTQPWWTGGMASATSSRATTAGARAPTFGTKK
jgi:hypothetical protein